MSTPAWLKALDPTTPRSAFGGVVKQGISMIPVVGPAAVQALDVGAAAAQSARVAAAQQAAANAPSAAPPPVMPTALAAPSTPSEGSPFGALPSWLRSPVALVVAAAVVVVCCVLWMRKR